MCELALTKAQSEKRKVTNPKVKSESAKRKRVLTPLLACQVLQQRIQQCLGLALSLNLSSIAFPTIGCGNLRYPVDKVARCFQTAVATTNNLQVNCVILIPGNAYSTLLDLYLFSHSMHIVSILLLLHNEFKGSSFGIYAVCDCESYSHFLSKLKNSPF